jgi:hypothetical protein
MKKIMLIIFSLIISVAFLGCDSKRIATSSYDVDGYEVNDYDDATLSVIEDTVSSKGLTIELNYYGEDEGTTGAWYALYIYEDDKWNELEYITDENIAWVMIAYIVKRNVPSQMEINWENLYGDLSSGRYLIVKQFNNREKPGEVDMYYLACEFSIE